VHGTVKLKICKTRHILVLKTLTFTQHLSFIFSSQTPSVGQFPEPAEFFFFLRVQVKSVGGNRGLNVK